MLAAVAERPAADAYHRLNDDRDHRGLESEEHPLEQRRLAMRDVDEAEAEDRQEPRQHEQHPGDHAAPRAVQQPSDVDRELLRLRPRQQHAEVERVQEPRLADPPLLVDEDAVHDRDLPGRPAERQRRDPEPDPHRLGERDAVRRHRRRGPGGHLGHGALRALGQLWVSPVASRHQR